MTNSKLIRIADRAGRYGGIPAICLLMLAHFAFLAIFFEPAISTPDANGYLAQARLIAENGRSDIVVENPAQYVGDHWMKVADGHYYGQYPPGLPAVLAVVYDWISPNASLWVIPVMGTLSLLATFLVVREWAGPVWGFIAAVLMFFNPYANAHALGADSHTAVCFFLLWGLYGLVRWERSKAAGWAVLAGLCLGMIPTIRYAEALFIIASAIFVLMVWRPSDGFRSLIAGIVAACVPMGALAIRNQKAFGAFWRTGYSVSGEQTGFAISYFVRYALPYIAMLFGIGVFVVWIFGLRGLAKLTRNRETWKRGLLLVLLIAPVTLLYFAYYFPANPKNMRFFLPTFYIYAIAACYSLSIDMRNDPQRAVKYSKWILILNTLWGLPFSIAELIPLKRDNAQLASITRQLQSAVKPGSILIAQRGIQQHLDFVGGWKLAPLEGFYRQPRPDRPLGPHMFENGGPGMRPGRPPEMQPEDRADRRPEARPEQGEQARNERANAFRNDLVAWANGQREIILVTSSDELKTMRERFGDRDTFVEQGTIQVDPGGRRRPGPPGDFEPGREGPGRDDEPHRKEFTKKGRRGFMGRMFGPPGPPPEFAKDGRGPRRKNGLGGRGPGGGGGPPRFEPPADGKFLIVQWMPNAAKVAEKLAE
jgi:4-amino-4-deoxy-L-arabinose transferase-like glycosyltransferase